MLVTLMTSHATGHYTPLCEAGDAGIEQLNEDIYRVEFRTSALTSHAQLDTYLHRRCAELALREGMTFFT